MVSVGSLVRLSSFITAKARAFLFNAIEEIGQEHVYYMDTDSMITDVEMNPAFVHPLALGKWKLESRIEQGDFISAKNYLLFTDNMDRIARCKGVQQSQLKASLFRTLRKGEIATVTNRDVFKRSLTGVIIKDQVKHIKPWTDKKRKKASPQEQLENRDLAGDNVTVPYTLYTDVINDWKKKN